MYVNNIMGKRKRRADENKTTNSEFVPQSSQMDALSQQESSHQVENAAMTPITSIMEIMEDSVKLPQISQLPVHHHHLSRAMLLRNPRYCSRKYSRRNLANQTHASTSHGKVIPAHDEKVVIRLADNCHSEDSGQRAESLARAFKKPEKIRTSSLARGAVSHDMGKMVCGICERFLRKKPLNVVGSSISPSEPSVVAVLVCGHLYHADCLEQKTSQEERMDPPCPLCLSLISQVDASLGQK